MPKQWYDDRCIAIGPIRKTVSRLCILAGIDVENHGFNTSLIEEYIGH